MAGDSPPCVPVYDLISLMTIDLATADWITMLTTEFSERITQQGCGPRLLRRAVNWRAAVGRWDEPVTGSDSLCTT